MRPLSAAQLLDAWERGLSEPAYRRALPVLAAAHSDSSLDALAALSVGERDRRLLTLRQWTFGSQLASVTNCSECGERLEWTIETTALQVGNVAETTGDLTVQVDDYFVRFRLPNTLDLASVSESSSASSARQALLEKCVFSARLEGEEILPSALPAAVTTEIARRMAEADPQADIELELSCPACGQHWQALFDIESFFWSEITAWAQRILSEVDRLARAYGWSEKDILNLSPWRRQFYLSLVGA